MGYLKSKKVTVEGHSFEIHELCQADFEEVVKNEEGQSVRAICKSVTEFQGKSEEEVSRALPPRLVMRLGREVIKLCAPEDLEGNSESAPTADSSSV